MKNAELVFLSNELLSPNLRDKLNLPMEFITFAMTDGKMYKHYNNNGVFFIPLGRDMGWGNTKVYGAVYLVKDFFFYASMLDAYHICSYDKLQSNHIRDTSHRVYVDVTPIDFRNIEELSSLQYREGKSINVVSYVGNIKHPRINKRFQTTKNYRMVSGVYNKPFLQQYREVL